MDYASFWAGGVNVLQPAGTTQRVFVRQINRPGWNVELHEFGGGAQQAPNSDYFMELLLGGKTIFAENVRLGFSTACFAVPFAIFEAMGMLELYCTNAGAVPNTVSAHVYGIYIPRINL